MDQHSVYRDALEDMTWQFAHRCDDGKRRWLTTGGLSALEHAFETLGWDDPHYTEDAGCEIAGCAAFSTCVGAYPRSLAAENVKPREMIGFGHLCSPHYHKWNGREAATAPDLGRLEEAKNV